MPTTGSSTEQPGGATTQCDNSAAKEAEAEQRARAERMYSCLRFRVQPTLPQPLRASPLMPSADDGYSAEEPDQFDDGREWVALGERGALSVDPDVYEQMLAEERLEAAKHSTRPKNRKKSKKRRKMREAWDAEQASLAERLAWLHELTDHGHPLRRMHTMGDGSDGDSSGSESDVSAASGDDSEESSDDDGAAVLRDTGARPAADGLPSHPPLWEASAMDGEAATTGDDAVWPTARCHHPQSATTGRVDECPPWVPDTQLPVPPPPGLPPGLPPGWPSQPPPPSATGPADGLMAAPDADNTLAPDFLVQLRGQWRPRQNDGAAGEAMARAAEEPDVVPANSGGYGPRSTNLRGQGPPEASGLVADAPPSPPASLMRPPVVTGGRLRSLLPDLLSRLSLGSVLRWRRPVRLVPEDDPPPPSPLPSPPPTNKEEVGLTCPVGDCTWRVSKATLEKRVRLTQLAAHLMRCHPECDDAVAIRAHSLHRCRFCKTILVDDPSGQHQRKCQISAASPRYEQCRVEGDAGTGGDSVPNGAHERCGRHERAPAHGTGHGDRRTDTTNVGIRRDQHLSRADTKTVATHDVQ